MDLFINILLMLHIFGLVLGMGSGLAASRISPMVAGVAGERRDMLFSIVKMLGKNGHVGLGLLWVTGILMVLLRYQGVASFGLWFWVKMVFVVILSASVGMTSAAYRRAMAGDESKLARAKMASAVSGVSGIAIIITAVLAFN